MKEKLKMKDYPKEIRDRVKETSSCYNPESEYGLEGQFPFFKQIEGDVFWQDVASGNFDVFYKRYPKVNNIEVNEPEVISDSIVDSVIESFKERSNVGIKKYGVTLDRDDLSFLEWINHLQTELQDAILYAERMKTTDGMSFSYDLDEIESMEMKDGKLTITTK